MYHDHVLEEGMIFTIEPGLYFHKDDLLVPSELTSEANEAFIKGGELEA